VAETPPPRLASWPGLHPCYDVLTNRAMTAYFREAKREGVEPDQPANTSGVVTLGGLDYVVLENIVGPIAVYRVRNDGKLKRLKRLPAGLDDN